MIRPIDPASYGDLKDRVAAFLLDQFHQAKRDWERVMDLRDLTPDEITANQNDYDPWAGEGEMDVLRLSTDASRDITGFVGGRPSRKIHVFNVGTNDLVLKDQDTNSVAENRIIVGTGADLTLTTEDSATLYYDSITLRWRVIN